MVDRPTLGTWAVGRGSWNAPAPAARRTPCPCLGQARRGEPRVHPRPVAPLRGPAHLGLGEAQAGSDGLPAAAGFVRRALPDAGVHRDGGSPTPTGGWGPIGRASPLPGPIRPAAGKQAGLGERMTPAHQPALDHSRIPLGHSPGPGTIRRRTGVRCCRRSVMFRSRGRFNRGVARAGGPGPTGNRSC